MTSKKKNNIVSASSETQKNPKTGLGKVGDDLNARVDKSIKTGKEVVKDHPIAVAGATLAVGVVAGVVLGRRTAPKSKKYDIDL